MKKVVILDIDGFVADFEPLLVETLVDEFGVLARVNRHEYSLEKRFEKHVEMRNFATKLVNYPPFYREVKPNPYAVEFVRQIMERGYPVLYVSSRPEICKTFTRLWLQKYTPNYSSTLGLMIGVQDKLDLLKEIDFSFIIEDNPDTVQKFKDAGKTAYLWSQEWNVGVFPRLFPERDGTAWCWNEEDQEAEMFWNVEEE